MNFNRLQKQLIVFTNDLLISIFATWLALFLRLGSIFLPNSFFWHENILYAFILSIILFSVIFINFKIYKVLFRFAGLKTLRSITIASIIYGLLFFLIIIFFPMDGIPRSIGLTQPFIFTLLVLISRIVAVQLIQIYSMSTDIKNIVVFGAGKSAVEASNALSLNNNYIIKAFIDVDKNKIGKYINEVPIFEKKDLSSLAKTQNITDILIALPNMGLIARKNLVEELESLNLNIKFLPSIDNLISGRLKITDFNPVNLDDILERKIDLNLEGILNEIKDKNILITGCGGSIGCELSTQVLLNRPKFLVLVDHSEFNLYTIVEKLNKIIDENQLNTTLVPRLISVQNRDEIENLYKQYAFEYTYHAAAYKHVPLIETNIIEAVKNNILATKILVDLCITYECKKFILVSTDKAVRPTNIMGATKRFAELIVQSSNLKQRKNNKTIFGIVRFGNVVNSSGSVIPLFSKQIETGGPITITDPEITRYFMTIPEAASLILQSGLIAKNGEVFVLNMGKPIKILDLARKILNLSGFQEKNGEEGDIEIKFTGLRPGEKLHEELFIDENNFKTINKDIFLSQETFIEKDELDIIIKNLEINIKNNLPNEIRKIFISCNILRDNRIGKD